MRFAYRLLFFCVACFFLQHRNNLSVRKWYSLANKVFGAPTIRTQVKNKKKEINCTECSVAKISNAFPMKSQFRINKNAHAACADCT